MTEPEQPVVAVPLRARTVDVADLTAADAAASLIHDYIWQKPVLSGTTPPSKEQASDAVWSIHTVLRAALAAADTPLELPHRMRDPFAPDAAMRPPLAVEAVRPETESGRPVRELLLGVLDDFDEWAGVDGRDPIDQHGAHWAKFIQLLRAALAATGAPNPEVRAEAEADRWSFKEGTVREKLVWCRWQHQIEAELNAKGTVYAQRTAEASAAWHRDCVTWYDGMIRDLDALATGAPARDEPGIDPERLVAALTMLAYHGGDSMGPDYALDTGDFAPADLTPRQFAETIVRAYRATPLAERPE